MKIAIFHNLGPGGAARQLVRQAKGLAERGHILDVFVANVTAEPDALPELASYCRFVKRYGPQPVPPEQSRPPAEEHRSSSLRERALSHPAGRAAAEWLWTRRRNAETAALAAFQREIASEIDANGYDIAYANQCRRRLAPDLIRFLERTPVLFCCNDTLRPAFEWSPETVEGYDEARETFLRRKRRGRFMSPPLLAFDVVEERRFVANTRSADAILANSWYTRERILCTTGRESRVCYPGIDTDYLSPTEESKRDRKLVVSIGALLPSKRHDLVLRAVATLPEDSRPRVEVIGYEAQIGGGHGPEGSRLLALASSLGVELALRREVTDEAIRDAYQRAGVVVFATYLEPLGLVPLEAMACGAPVVGVAEAGIRETVRDGETGLLTGAQPAELGAAIRRVLEDSDLAARLSTGGRAGVVRDWKWDRSVDVVEDSLRRTADSGRRKGNWT